MVVAPATRIELSGDRLVFTFPADRRTAAAQLKKKREWVEGLVSQVVGRRLTVEAVQEREAQQPSEARLAGDTRAGGAGDGAVAAVPGRSTGDGAEGQEPAAGLRERALGDSMVRAVLDLFPAEITDIESIR